jgi:ferredoxin
MNKFWKPFRIIISLIVLISVAFIFLDFRQNISSPLYRIVTWFQFVPSVTKFLITAGLISTGFIVVILLTLLFGRVYCSTVCPLGIIQDVITFFSRKFRKKKFRFKFARPKNVIRYSFLALAVVPLFFGMVTLLGLLDPYSNFGRIFSGLGQPVYIASNNLLSELLIKIKVYMMFPEELPPVHLATIIYPVIVLGVIMIMASRWGRLYCNTICPVGTFLGLLSRFSIFKIKIDHNTCTKCAKCAVACKSQCINLKDQSVDVSRCVGCFNCINSCRDKSISYRLSIPKKNKEAQLAAVQTPLKNDLTDLSKRQFISGSLVLTGAMLGISGSLKAEEKTVHGESQVIKKKKPCSPPGSIGLEHFNDICTACHLCVSACPNGVIRPSLLQYGLEGFLQPFMDASSGYCNFDCTVCGEVCPTGAILPLTKEEKQVTQIGVVKFIKEICVVYTDETLCGACSEHCPTKAVKMVPYKDNLNIPEVEPDICVGCGACEHACPVRPQRAIYVEGLTVHQVAKKPEIKESKEGTLEEFPF